MRFNLCTWLNEIYSCSCLSVLARPCLGPASQDLQRLNLISVVTYCYLIWSFCSYNMTLVIVLLEEHSTTERLFSTAKLRQIVGFQFHISPLHIVLWSHQYKIRTKSIDLYKIWAKSLGFRKDNKTECASNCIQILLYGNTTPLHVLC